MVKRILRRRRIITEQEELVILRRGSNGHAASSEEDIFHVCPTCGTHLSFTDKSPTALQISAAPDVTAYGAAEISEHGCIEGEITDEDNL